MVVRVIYKKGFGIIEVLIAASIIVAVLSALIAVNNIFISSSSSNIDKLQATFLAEEGIEAVKSIRDYGWATKIATLTNNTTYYLVFTSGQWVATTTPQYVDGKLRSFTLDPAYRNGSDQLASSCTLDVETKKVTVSVAWAQKGATTTKTVSTYITNLFDS